MERNLKKIRTIAIILIAILISVIAFVGLYVKEYGIWSNKLPEFNLGMELKGIRELHFVLDTEETEKEVYVDSEGNYAGDVLTDNNETQVTLETEGEDTNIPEENKDIEGYTREKRTIKANEDNVKTIENFEKAKKIIQKRLETMEFYEYNIRQDTVTGEVVIEVPDDENIGIEQTMISTIGNIEIIDAQTGLILIDNSHVKKATMLDTSENGYQAYLQLEFDKVGTEKLKEISNNYQTVTADDGTETTNYITIKMDEQTLSTTYFAEELASGMIQLPMGKATQNYDEYIEVAKSVSMIADIVNQESMPIAYTLSSDNYIKSTITTDMIKIAKITFIAVIIVISLYLIIRFKFEGFKAAIFSIAYIGILSIIVKYTNVVITINALIALLAVIIINYVFYIKFLQGLNKENNKKIVLVNTMKELYLTIIPVCIISIIFTFMSSVVISSIGMILFWGLFVQAIYSCLALL